MTTFRRRCGKPGYRCTDGDPHESTALQFTEDGRTKAVTLSAAEAAEVTAALPRYEQARGRELLHRLLQDHLGLHAVTEARLPVVTDQDQVVHAAIEPGHTRRMASAFGPGTGPRISTGIAETPTCTQPTTC